ncbi:MAG: heavy metal-binding domain-containing protein [Nitrospirae bacterium]|nr:MAG: heavy metal-binding domain-containing protein [Nitrospirota bacterium]
MTCPLCGIGILPGKICINCGYDPSRPGVRPASKPAIPEPPRQEAKPDPLASFRDMLPSTEKKGKSKQKDKAPAARTTFSDADDLLQQIDKLGPVTQPAAAPPRATLQQATVPVTTQFAFEGRHIGGYAGLVASTVVVRIGSHDDLLPEGMEMQRLGGGPIGMRLRKAIDLAIADLKTEALERGANAVVGARLEVLPAHGPLAIVTLIGTAVILE